jgi:membrane associated rhomboid family serine protease
MLAEGNAERQTGRMTPLEAVRGLQRVPVLTAVVFAVTALVNAAQLVDPGLLRHLERTNAALHGQPWRIATSLFVQDGGALGTFSNLLFLAVIGTCAEQVLSRKLWLVHYFGIGLLAELVALSWQPTGGGNSIAVCGLTGALALAYRAGDARMPRFALPATLLWLGALVGTIGSAAYAPAIGGAVVLGAGLRRLDEVGRGELVRTVQFVCVLAVGIVLCCLENIHGAALLLSCLLALATVGVRSTTASADGRTRARVGAGAGAQHAVAAVTAAAAEPGLEC